MTTRTASTGSRSPASRPKVQELVEWAQPIQQRHFEDTRRAALELAKQEA